MAAAPRERAPGADDGVAHHGVPDQDTVDVLVVGYGPVGQVLASLLASRGWRTVAVDRQPEPYPLPRAVSVDGNAARVLAAAGIADTLDAECVPSPDYVVVDRDGRELVRVPLGKQGPYGWPDALSVYQPGLEQALARRGEALPALRVRRGTRAVALHEHASHVAVETCDVADGRRATTRARWVVGCDGAGSTVRAGLGTEMEDSGFACDWMACDVLPADPHALPPRNLQVADPARPRVAVTAGPRVRRFEFMRMPDEPVASFDREDTARRLLGLFDADEPRARLVRHASYTVRGALARAWRRGRVLLAGDAAHQMPPFAGQGLCSGLRDAANLAWKLDLVLSARAGEGLLDTYETERRPDVQHAVDLSVALGRLICAPAGVAAASATHPPAPPPDGPGADGRDGAPSLPGPLRDGFLGRTDDGRPAPGAGVPSPQGRLRAPAPGGPVARLDALVPRGFVLLTSPDGTPGTRSARHALLRRLDVTVVPLVAPGARDPGPSVWCDVDDVYLPWLRALGAVAVLVRPDFYVLGAARDTDALGRLLDGVEARLRATFTTPVPAAHVPS